MGSVGPNSEPDGVPPQKRRKHSDDKSHETFQHASRDVSLTSASLECLPRDIIFNLCDYLATNDIINLFQVSSRLATFGGKDKNSLLIHYDWAHRICNAMLWACEHGDITFASSLLSYGYDLEEVDSIWLSAERKLQLRPPEKHACCLHHPGRRHQTHKGIDLSLLNKAVDCDQPDFVRFLFENGKESGKRPLKVKEIEASRGKYDNSTLGYLSLLHLARSAQMLRLLLAMNPDLPIDDGPVTEYEPLRFWHVERRLEIDGLSVLLREGARPDGAVISSHLEQLDYLCGCRSSLPLPQAPLEAAIYHSNVPAFQLLLDWGAEFEYKPASEETGEMNLQSYVAMYFFSTTSGPSCELAGDILKTCVAHGLDLQAPYKRQPSWLVEQGQDTLPGYALIHCDSVTMIEVLINLGTRFDVPIGQLFDLKSRHTFHGREHPINENLDPGRFLLQTVFRRVHGAAAASGDPEFAGRSFFNCLRRKLQILRRQEKGADELSNLEFVVKYAPGCRLEATVGAVLGAYGSARPDRHCLRLLLERSSYWSGTFHTLRRLVETLICAGAPISSQAGHTSVLCCAFQIPVTPRPFPKTFDLVNGINSFWEEVKATKEGSLAPIADEIWQRQDNVAAIINLLIGHGAELKDEEISAARKSGWVPPTVSFQLQRLYAVTGKFSTPTSTEGQTRED